MPKFKPRRGGSAVDDAAARKGGGNFRSFVPEISWREDGEKKYILVLSDFAEPDEDGVGGENSVVVVDLHEWIQVGVWEKANGETKPKYETFVSRKDPLAGSEEYDDLEDRLGNKPRTRSVGVAIELEPVLETVKGRKKPTGFIVKTDTFTRKTDDGEQEVVQPLIGVVSQSSALMWSPLRSLDEAKGPLGELPIEVTRRGKSTDTRYDFVDFEGRAIDLGPLFDNLDGITYLKDELDEVNAQDLDASLDNAQLIAQLLLEKRLTELADKERYDELVGPITELPAPKYGNNNKKATSTRPSRPTRTSPREVKEAPTDAEERFEKLKSRFNTA